MILSHISNEICHNFSNIKHDIQQPDFIPSYMLFCMISATTASVCLKISPKDTLKFIHFVYLIDRVVSPIFSNLLEPYRHTTLIPLMGQLTHLTISAILAKRLCFAISRIQLSARQVLAIGLLCLISKSITKIIMNSISHSHKFDRVES